MYGLQSQSQSQSQSQLELGLGSCSGSGLNYNKKDLKKSINFSINGIIEKKIQKSDNNSVIIMDESLYDGCTGLSDKINNKTNNETYSDNEDETISLEKLEKEFVLKSRANSILYPKNYGNVWTDEERKKILKCLKKNIFCHSYGLFDESNIMIIAKKLERTEYGVKEEIKKMIFNDYICGLSHDKISKNFNIPETNIKLILKLHIEKNGKKIINSIESDNKLLSLQIENIKLRKELEELTK